MSQRKAWTKQEDQLLIKIMKENGLGYSHKRLKWNQIGDKISEVSINRTRSGKQCRQRWFNQLHPDINNESQWSKEEEEVLFTLQAEYGNKWAKIATRIPGRSDNNIKNYFYSTLRKAVRRVNNYVAFHKRSVVYKNLKAFQSNTLNKILTVAQNRADRKVIVGKQSASSLAKDIRDSLIRIQIKYTETQINQLNHIMDALITKMQEFNKICKRRKTKKKDIADEQKSASQNYQPSLILVGNHQSSNEAHQSFLHQSQVEEQIQGSKDENENKPLHGHDRGQQGVRKEKSESFRQVESQQVNEDKILGEPLIPSLQSSNSYINFSFPYRSFQKTQQSQCLQPNSLHYDQSFNHQVSNLSFIPLVQPNIFTGSVFLPTPFYPHPFMSYPPPSNTHPNHSGFQMNWSHQYAVKRIEEFNSIQKSILNIQQSNKQIDKGKQ